MSIMDTFRNAFGANQQANPPINPNAQKFGMPATQPPMQAGASADGQIPGGQAIPQEPQSPFADFQKLWDTPVADPNKPQDGPIKFNIDPSKVNQSAKNIDFTKTVTPALMEKVKAGGEGAMEAMLSAMNEMVQASFAQTMMANTKILESGLESSHQRVQASLPGTIRKQAVGQALREDNPLFSNPATAPMLQMLETQLTSQFPTATIAEIQEHAKRYLSAFAGEVTKTQTVAAPQDPRGKEIDWSTIPTI
jgi:hypothetical protein